MKQESETVLKSEAVRNCESLQRWMRSDAANLAQQLGEENHTGAVKEAFLQLAQAIRGLPIKPPLFRTAEKLQADRDGDECFGMEPAEILKIVTARKATLATETMTEKQP
jgi:hypothetical protein